MENEKQYFGTLETKELAGELLVRLESFSGSRKQTETRWKRNYRYFYNYYYEDSDELTAQSVKYGGEQDELTLISANHFKNILQHWHVMITGVQPSYQPRATNSDYKSLAQAKLATDLIDYYSKEKDLNYYTSTAVMHSLIMDAGYIRVEWDTDSGREYTVDDNDAIKHEGDIKISNPNPHDIVFDLHKKDFRDNDWVIVRSFKSRWDVINSYVEFGEDGAPLPGDDAEMYNAILNIEPSGDYVLSYRTHDVPTTSNDDLEIFEFYHKKTKSLPDGRYMMFASNDLTFIDMPLPYKEIPIYQVTAGQDVANQFGYSIANDLCNLQEMLNAEYSAVATNHDQFAVQSVVAPREANVKSHKLADNLQLVEYDPTPGATGGGEPHGLNLTSTPPEVFQFMQMLEQAMETVSGINSVIRGQPTSNLQSGVALALVQNQALNFASHLQGSYAKMLEDVGTAIVRTLRDYAQTERVITISGKHNRSAMKEFTGSDLENIDRVIVDLGNPLSQTLAGRVELAQNLIQTGLIKTIEEYITVVNTGQLTPLTETVFSELQNIHSENEELMEGRDVMSIATDDHRLHILEHKILLDDPETRRNGEHVGMILQHIHGHIQMMQDPMTSQLSQVLGHMNLAQQPGTPAGPAQPSGEAPPPDVLTEIPQNAVQQGGPAARPQQPRPPRQPRGTGRPPQGVPQGPGPGGPQR